MNQCLLGNTRRLVFYKDSDGTALILREPISEERRVADLDRYEMGLNVQITGHLF
jgi:hypothetical protein